MDDVVAWGVIVVLAGVMVWGLGRRWSSGHRDAEEPERVFEEERSSGHYMGGGGGFTGS